MKLKKNYLTAEEMTYIVATLVERDDVTEREILKIGLVAQLLLDENSIQDYDDNVDIYNYVMEHQIDFNSEIVNYKDIDRLVGIELGVDKTVKKFLEGFEQKFSEDLNKSLNGFNLEELLTKLKEIGDGSIGVQ